MKQLILTSVIVMMIAGATFAAAPGIFDDIVPGQVLNGQHYNLNIIGVKNPKKTNMDDNGGGVIFVDLNGHSKIELEESGVDNDLDPEAFAVLDKNATDNSPGVLSLPNPGLEPYVIEEDPDADTITNYSIFVRALGSPQGNPYAKITTCADVLESDLADFLDKDEIEIINDAGYFGGYCSIESTGQLMREKGQSIFTNQTAALLTIVLEVDVIVDDLVVETLYVRIPIFDDMLENEYWDYDNNGLKLLQVRIYRVGTDVSNSDLPEWFSLPLI
jgi:hypothetical protein